MISIEEVQTLLNSGGAVVSEDGTKIGDIAQVYLDDETGDPEWVTTKVGMFGGESFIPLAQSSVQDNAIRVPYSKDKVKGAPSVSESDGHVSGAEEAELYTYYGLTYSYADEDADLPAGNAAVEATAGTDQTSTVGHDTSGPTTDDAMTRSEEKLKVGTQSRVAGRARLVKYTVTEEKTITVPVTRTEVRIEHDPIDADSTADTSTTASGDSSHASPGDSQAAGALTGDSDVVDSSDEVILTEERIVVTKETVPVKRVRLAKETVTTEEQVIDTVRKERIETEGVDETRSP